MPLDFLSAAHVRRLGTLPWLAVKELELKANVDVW